MVLTAAAATALAGGLTAAGSVGSGMLGMMAANHGAYKQYKYNSKLQKQAAKLNYDYGIKSLQNSPAAQRLGLESAGYNPMLAVQNATSGANAGWTSNSSVSQPDYSGAVSSFTGAYQNLQHLANETKTAEASQDEAYANADEAKSRKALNLAKLPFVSKREKAEISNIEKNSAKLENDIHYQNEMINYYNNSLKLQQMGLEPQIINAGANATSAQTQRLQYEIDKEVQEIVRDKEKRYKEWGSKHPYLRNVDETLTRYFNGFGANAGVSRSSSIKR